MTRFNFANLLADRGQLDEAIASYRVAIRGMPGLAARFRVNLAAALFRQQRLDEAAAELREAVRSEPDMFQGWANLGVVLGKLGDAEGAAEPPAGLRSWPRPPPLRPRPRPRPRPLPARHGSGPPGRADSARNFRSERGFPASFLTRS